MPSGPRRRQRASLIFLAVLLTGCGAPGAPRPTSTATQPPAATAILAEPPAPATVAPNDAPTVSTSPTASSEPAAAATGTVRGVLVDRVTGQPVPDVRMTLGLAERDAQGQVSGYEVSASEGTLLRSTVTDGSGAFSITAEPGEYVLVSPGGTYDTKMARDASGMAIVLFVEAGQEVDLGSVGR